MPSMRSAIRLLKYNQSLKLRSDQPEGEGSVMFSRQITAVSIAALLFTTTAMAQPAKTLELGIFGDYRTRTVDNRPRRSIFVTIRAGDV